MDVRVFGEHDYETLEKWWRIWDWQPIPRSHLPTGFIIDDGGKSVCAGFLYYTGTAFGHFEFIVSDPKSDPEVRAKALDLLIQTAKEASRDLGILSLFVSVEHIRLIERLQNHGFQVVESNMTNMIARV